MLLPLLVLFLRFAYGYGNPRAIVHIGPPKTATTYIQEFLSLNVLDMQKSNLYWPCGPQRHKCLAIFSSELDKVDKAKSIIGPIEEFVNSSRAKNRSIILSAENFSGNSLEGVAILKSMLRGFDVTIIYVYREFISHLLSAYYQLNRLDPKNYLEIQPFQPLPSFITENFDSLNVQLDLRGHLRAYEDVFGKEAMAVVDLRGCESAEVNVAYVVVCEIAGVLCDRNDLFNDDHSVSPVNAQKNLVIRELFGYYNNFIMIYGANRKSRSSKSSKRVLRAHRRSDVNTDMAPDVCRLCSNLQGLKEELEIFEKHIHDQQKFGTVPEIPLIRTHLSMLVPFAEEMDRKLREGYGDEILYGNTTANLKAMHEEAYTEFVDGDALMNSVEWREWMTRTYYEDLKHGRLCGCNAE